MSDVLGRRVSTIKKELRGYSASDSSLVSSIFRGIKRKKTYEILQKLDKAGRVMPHLSHYTKYQNATLDQLQKTLSAGESNFRLFELLVITHLVFVAQGERLFDFEKYFTVANSYSFAPPEPSISDVDFISDIISNIKTSKSTLTNVEFAETLTIPAGPYKGRLYQHDRAPYNRQIHQWMSPEDPCRELVNMWGVQIGKSTALENTFLYYMKVRPSETLAVLATLDAAEKFSKKRIEPRASQAGIKFIAETFGDGKKRASGNKVLSKEFPGGNFDAVTAGSPSKLASETKLFIGKDELDRWPDTVGSEGDPDAVADARADAWGDQAKIYNVSSPTLVHTSKIYKKFLEGTQHHFHVQCPLCDAKYPLEMGMGRDSGLRYETKAGKIDKSMIFYLCPKCKDAWFETDKLGAMRNGIWVPHATALRENVISTQLSQLYSPFKGWYYVCTNHKRSVDDPDKEQEFTNMTLGLPYEPKGQRPESEKLIQLRDETYRSREVPEDVLYIVAACDVQRGSTSANRKNRNKPRLEIEILGICDSFVTKSIEYLVVEGDTSVSGRGAWEKLNDLFADGHFVYERRRDGFEYRPVIWLFDARDGERTEVVYEHCRSWGDRVYPSMGRSYIQRGRKNNDGFEDAVSEGDYARYRKKTVDSDLTVYQISTNHYKTKTYSNLNSTIQHAGETGSFAGKCHFPADYPDVYFDMLTAEERRPDGTFFCPSGRRNETLDIRVYALAAADIWINMYIKSLKDRARSQGAKYVDHINFTFARDLLARNTQQLWAGEPR